jgi:hypothetical protein
MIDKAARRAIREARVNAKKAVKAFQDAVRLQREAYRTCFQRRPRRIVDEADE